MKKTKRIAQDRQLIKHSVRMLLSGRLFVCFFAWLLPAALPWVMRLIPVNFGIASFLVADFLVYQVSVPMFVLSFVATLLVTDPMQVRLAAFYMQLNRNPENLPSPLSVCDCFGPGYFRLVGGMGLRSVVISAFALLPLLLGALIPGVFETVTLNGEQVIRVDNSAALFLLASALITIYLDLKFLMVRHLLADNPGMGAVEAMRECAALTRGRIGELLVLELSFFGWMLIASMTFMIGAVYAYPYLEGTIAAYYIAFTRPLPWQQEMLRDDDAP